MWWLSGLGMCCKRVGTDSLVLGRVLALDQSLRSLFLESLMSKGGYLVEEVMICTVLWGLWVVKIIGSGVGSGIGVWPWSPSPCSLSRRSRSWYVPLTCCWDGNVEF